MPRPIVPGERRALNKRVVEHLADKSYELEINAESSYRVWAYRKAAWAVEEMEQDIGLVYRTLGLNGLQSIPNIGQSLGKIVEDFLMRLDVGSVSNHS
jgi:DNA polymerase/3'-5' exonuclease PolX